MLSCVESETTLMTLPACKAAVSPLPPYLPVFPPQAFPTLISFITPPQAIYQSTTNLLWDWSQVPTFQLPVAVLSRGLVSPSEVRRAAASIVYVILIPFRLSPDQLLLPPTASNVSSLSQAIALV